MYISLVVLLDGSAVAFCSEWQPEVGNGINGIVMDHNGNKVNRVGRIIKIIESYLQSKINLQ